MTLVELGVRYQAGRAFVAITMRDGHVVQLHPFAAVRFREQPLRIEGRLYRRSVEPRYPRYETKVP